MREGALEERRRAHGDRARLPAEEGAEALGDVVVLKGGRLEEGRHLPRCSRDARVRCSRDAGEVPRGGRLEEGRHLGVRG